MLDTINALFEAGGAVLLWLNVRRLYSDKRLLGISLVPTIWYTTWGAWNLVYYYGLGQLASWVAGIGVFMANAVWVSLAVYYGLRR
jgi:hypothetical protein